MSAVPAALSLETNASAKFCAEPVRRKAPTVVGKSGDCVVPAMNEFPLASTAIPLPVSALLPPRKVVNLMPGIDHELVIGSVLTDVERELATARAGAADHVAAGHRYACSVDVLVRHRCRVLEQTDRCGDLQSPIRAHGQRLRALVCQPHGGR
jgi:hypothetical protein